MSALTASEVRTAVIGAAALAARAARIQRDYVEARRKGKAGGYVNGHATALGARSSKGEAIVTNRQAHELSGMAARRMSE